MFMNLHTIPEGQRMYTLGVTGDPVDTPEDKLGYDEVDFITSSNLTSREVARRAQQAGALEGYEGCRVIGVIDQSSGYVLCQDVHGNLLDA